MVETRVKTITGTESRRCGWPTVARRKNGELLAVYSGGRQEHVDPLGQVHLIRSSDNGATWTLPRVLADGPIDDRDAGVLETSKGTVLVSYFTSVTWVLILEAFGRQKFTPLNTITDSGESPGATARKKWDMLKEEQIAEWSRRRALLTDDIVRRELGAWIIRSTDGGATFSPKIPCPAGTPHGPFELSDGRLLMVGKKCADGVGDRGSPFSSAIGAAESRDDGQSWQWLSDFVPAQGHDPANYHEPHAVEAPDGTIIVHVRSHNEPVGDILQCESIDGGRSWSRLHSIGLWGYPAHLLSLRDGRLLTTFGHRREPYGNQYSISTDNGRTWSVQRPINTDSQGDLGYPSTVELADGRLLTVWYDANSGLPFAGLRQAIWRVE